MLDPLCPSSTRATQLATPPPPPVRSRGASGAPRLTTRQATGQQEPLVALQALACAPRQCDARQTPSRVAARQRHVVHLARTARPLPCRSGASAARGWADRVLALPPDLVLLVLAEARWFQPARLTTWRRRARLARFLLDALERRHAPVDTLLVSALLTSPLIDPGSALVIRRALTAYAAGDDLVSLHLLVPRVEPMLQRLLPSDATARESGAPLVSGAWTLARLLRQPALRRALGPGLTLHLCALLLGGGGDGLRHQLAHGRLDPAVCVRPLTQDLLLAYLRLSRISVPPLALEAV